MSLVWRFQLTFAGACLVLITQIDPATAATGPAPTPAPTRALNFLNAEAPGYRPVDNMVPVHGVVFEDANGNGKPDAGETLLKGVTVRVQQAHQPDAEATLLTTDESGGFWVNAPDTAIVSLVTPEGWRCAGAVSQYAQAEVAFGLRADRLVVERVMPAPAVTVTTSAFEARTGLWFAGGLGLVLLACTLLVTRELRRNGKVAAELHDADTLRDMAVPSFAVSRTGAGNASQLGIPSPPQLPGVLADYGSGGMDDSTEGLFARRFIRNDADWFRIAEQVVADTLHQSVQIEFFIGLNTLPQAWIRFGSRDGRVFTFALTRTHVDGCRWQAARAVASQKSRRADWELRMLYHHFAVMCDMPPMLPRDRSWWLFENFAVQVAPGGAFLLNS